MVNKAYHKFAARSSKSQGKQELQRSSYKYSRIVSYGTTDSATASLIKSILDDI